MKVLDVNDLDFLKHIFFHESIYPFISDDQEIEDYNVVKDALISDRFTIISPNEQVVFLLSHINLITCEVHTLILPEGRGKKGIESGKESIAWTFENTRYEKIISWVPTYNRMASLYAIKCGFKREGVSKKSWKKQGKYYDMILYGIEKE